MGTQGLSCRSHLPLGSLCAEHTFPSASGHPANWALCPPAATSAVRCDLADPVLELRAGGQCTQSLTPPAAVPAGRLCPTRAAQVRSGTALRGVVARGPESPGTEAAGVASDQCESVLRLVSDQATNWTPKKSPFPFRVTGSSWGRVEGHAH